MCKKGSNITVFTPSAPQTCKAVQQLCVTRTQPQHSKCCPRPVSP